MHRDKYRIRIYRYSDKEIFLERKRKMGDLIQKSSVQITRRLCDQLIAGDPRGLQTSSNPLLQDMYVQMRLRLMRPAVIVDYAREAYLHPASERHGTRGRPCGTAWRPSAAPFRNMCSAVASSPFRADAAIRFLMR